MYAVGLCAWIVIRVMGVRVTELNGGLMNSNSQSTQSLYNFWRRYQGFVYDVCYLDRRLNNGVHSQL